MNLKPEQTPYTLGYKMPGEWEKHEATWLAWPHNKNDWPGKFQAIPWVYADIVKNLSHVEKVHILVNDATAEKRTEAVLRRAGADLANVVFHQWRTDRVWTRDSGPIFVRNADGQMGITNWKFNAWAKYDNWQFDNQLPELAANSLQLPQWTPTIRKEDGTDHRMVLEGGSIDVNGQGLLITTEECLLSTIQQRNPGISKEQLENTFREYLGIEKVLWMNQGVAGDDTHGHVDDITRFVAPNTIATVVETNSQDENYEPLQENLERLKAARNLNGESFEIVELPMPAPVVFSGQRLPASYGNFYIANELVLVPTFNDPKDRKALGILAELFPDRKVTGIHCGDFIWGLGAMHCMTQQQPAAQ